MIMKKKINIQEVDFEVYLDNALKSCGYLFPETDEQISIFEKDMDQREEDRVRKRQIDGKSI